MARPRPASKNVAVALDHTPRAGEVAGDLRQLFVGRSAPGQPKVLKGRESQSSRR